MIDQGPTQEGRFGCVQALEVAEGRGPLLKLWPLLSLSLEDASSKAVAW